MKDQAQFQALSVATIFFIEDSVFPLFSESEQCKLGFWGLLWTPWIESRGETPGDVRYFSHVNRKNRPKMTRIMTFPPDYRKVKAKQTMYNEELV